MHPLVSCFAPRTRVPFYNNDYTTVIDAPVQSIGEFLFNGPLGQSDHTERAARTAQAMQQGIGQHASGLAVGIGIHRGAAVVGRVGTPERMEYTAVGSTVNVASRLCSAAESGAISEMEREWFPAIEFQSAVQCS